MYLWSMERPVGPLRGQSLVGAFLGAIIADEISQFGSEDLQLENEGLQAGGWEGLVVVHLDRRVGLDGDREELVAGAFTESHGGWRLRIAPLAWNVKPQDVGLGAPQATSVDNWGENL